MTEEQNHTTTVWHTRYENFCIVLELNILRGTKNIIEVLTSDDVTFNMENPNLEKTHASTPIKNQLAAMQMATENL